MKNKTPIILISLVALFIAAFFLLSKNKEPVQNTNNIVTTTPTRTAEINGIVLSIEGNSAIISNEVGKKVLTPEEQAKRRTEMQKLSAEERQIEKQKELEGVTYEKKEITIPVGVTIVKGTGDATGNSLPAALSEIKKDTYLSVWLNANGVVEAVKIKGLN